MTEHERAARVAALRVSLRNEIYATCALLEIVPPAHLGEWNEAALIEKVDSLRRRQSIYTKGLMRPGRTKAA